MRKLILLCIALVGFKTATAQQQDADLPKRDINKNEISLNPLYIVAFGALDVGYERILTDYSSLGLDVFYKLSNRDSDNNDSYNDDLLINTEDIFDKELALTLRFKYFFGNRIARGFYTEAFGMLSSGEHKNYVQQFGEHRQLEYTDFALGFAVGGKFVSQNGFLLDLGFGLGRNLFNDESPRIIIRPNIFIGYRF